jgi:uncharacterized protein YgbK (DUF1537 family)
MILVISDDISGAAEIGAVGQTFGLTAQIQMKFIRNILSDLVVIDTDSRYKGRDPARDIEQALANYDKTSVEWYYKKVDSVLRGNVADELCAMMKVLQRDRAILAPANPTKARVISNGQYFINGQLLHETDFANDLDYPAKTSNVVELLNVTLGCPLCVRTLSTYNSYEQGIIVAEAESMGDLFQWSKYVDEHTLAAGGSDFFRALLEKGFSSNRASSETEITAVSGKKLFVCGSASDISRKTVAQAVDLGIPVCPMPDTLFYDTIDSDALLGQWADCVLEALSASGRAIIAILQPVVRDSKLAQNLRMKTAALVQRVVSKMTIHELFIEGGATAEAVLRELNWQRFDVIGQYAPGVVQMRVPQESGNYVTIKPGSYPWPRRVWL